jgi:IclR family KDG regulon transcriptional repressor
MAEIGDKGLIKSVQKSLKILKVIMDATDEISLTDIEKLLGFHSSTTHHLLKTLMEEGFVSQNAKTKKYSVGPEVFLSWISHRHPEKYFNRVVPVLDECVSITDETTNLFIRDEDELICVAGSESKQILKAYLMIGRRIPIPCTAAGKVILAYMEEPEILSLLQRVGLRKYMPKTITDVTLLLKELKQIRAQGYAIELDEYEEMITAVGFPIQDDLGKVICSITCLVPSFRAEPQKLDFIIQYLKQMVPKIKQVLQENYY